jgi:hypothetical protein
MRSPEHRSPPDHYLRCINPDFVLSDLAEESMLVKGKAPEGVEASLTALSQYYVSSGAMNRVCNCTSLCAKWN